MVFVEFLRDWTIIFTKIWCKTLKRSVKSVKNWRYVEKMKNHEIFAIFEVFFPRFSYFSINSTIEISPIILPHYSKFEIPLLKIDFHQIFLFSPIFQAMKAQLAILSLLVGLLAAQDLRSLLDICANPPKTTPKTLSDKISLPESYKVAFKLSK